MDYFFVHHVGGRSGFLGFPEVSPLNKSISITSYEADADCCEEIERFLKSKGYSSIEVIPECIGNTRSASFNINFCPYTSSLLETNEEFENYYYDQKNYDYVIKDAFKKEKEIIVDIKSLDSIRSKKPIDFLSLDTQGSELDIITSGNNSLNETVGVLTEVSFLRLYKDCPMFGDIGSQLEEKGFQLINIEFDDGWAPLNLPQKLRLNKIKAQGDALFLRKPKNTLSNLQKRKLVFTAIIYGQIEYAIECSKGLKIENHINKLHWQYAVDELIKIRDQKDNYLMPKRFNKKFLKIQNDRHIKRQKIFSKKGNFINKLLYLVNIIISKILSTLLKLYTHLKSKKNIYMFKASKLELLYKNIGLNKYANQLKYRRLSFWL